MADNAPPRTPPGRRRGIRNFIYYAFGLSIALHIIFGPLLGHFKQPEQDKEPEQTVQVQKVTAPTPRPTPPPTPTAPPTTPPPHTPPPQKNTPPPPRPLLVHPPKQKSESKSGAAVPAYVPPKGGSEGGQGGGAGTGTGPVSTAPPATPEPTPVPTQKPTCANPNVPATTTNPVAPDTPEIAKEQGITGDVEVEVDLDANSKVTSVSIHKSPSPVLNNPAIQAAKASTFKTQIVNCVPVAASYLYIVEFQSS